MSNVIGKRLLSERKRAGLLQREVAKKAFVSRQVYCDYELGEHLPSFEAVERLAGVFKVTPQYLVGWSKERTG